MKKIQPKILLESKVRRLTPPRVAPRLKAEVKNTGIKPKKKAPKKA